MFVKKEEAVKLLDLLLKCSYAIAIKAHEYLGNHNKIRGYFKYPIPDNIFPKDNPEYDKYRKEIPYLIYDITKYELKDFPDNRIHYGAIFDGYNDDRIKIEDIIEFKELLDYILNTPGMIKVFAEEEKSDNIKYRIKDMIYSSVVRYLYKVNASSDVPDDIDDHLKSYNCEALLRYIDEKLKINICIPICLATFEEDNIKLFEHGEIVRIPEEIQKSRQKACSYEANNEDWVAACATHMIVLHNYQFENKAYFSINEATRNSHAYPIQTIDEIMAIIRVVTGYSIGYEQILTLPLGWIDTCYEDLQPIYGAKAYAVNSKETEKFWMQLPVSFIDSEQIKQIRDLYIELCSVEKNKKTGKLFFALKRLNRCMLRDEKDDRAIDATIGLEALLSGGTQGEITYTISNRIPVVFTSGDNTKYKSENVREIMRKIYNYRSRVVHGDELRDNDKIIEINDTKMEVEDLAVDFLRCTLLYILKNPKYLDAKKFDECIDGIIAKYKKNECK